MGIVDEDIVRVRDSVDIVQIISNYTQLRRVGSRFTGLCPFHTEKSPSFSVNAQQGLYYCFGCQAKGDAITFIREQEQLDFVTAVEFLASKAGVTLNYTDKNEGEDRKRRAKLHDAIEKAVEWYHQRLLTSPDAAPARSYLRQRGYDGEVVREYRMGWAPAGWDNLAKALKMSNSDWTDSGLGNLNSRGGKYDFFRERVLFPIFDAEGRAMGFGGRILPGSDDPAKYRNSADSRIYHKSRVLYGLNWAKSEVVRANEVIVCEGYTDVIGFAQAGVPRAVATCGTALTEDHVKLLSKFAKRVVLSFDADAAGQNAAARFYEWEKTYNLDVRVVGLPPGDDPGELARTDPERLAGAVAEAKPYLAFRVERELAAGDMSTAEGRARTAEAALAMVAEHPDALVKDQYAMTIAGRCRLDTDLVRGILANGPRPKAQAVAVADKRVPVRQRTLTPGPELEALTLAVQRRDELAPLIVPELFADDLYATVYDVVLKSASLHEAIEAGGPDVGDLIQRLSVEDSPNQPDDVAARLWARYLERRREECRQEIRQPGADIGAVNQHLAWFTARLGELQDPARRASVVDALLGWLHQSNGNPSS